MQNTFSKLQAKFFDYNGYKWEKSQTANVALKDVDLEKFAKFLSTIQLRWENLQCKRIKLTRKKGLPDTWDVDLVFKYYY